jgi:hypothetical protein
MHVKLTALFLSLAAIFGVNQALTTLLTQTVPSIAVCSIHYFPDSI